MIKSRMIVFVLIIASLLGACGGSGESSEPPSPGGDVEEGMAPIEKVEVLLLESFPLQVHLKVEGYMPDGCTEVASTEVDKQDHRFEVTIRTSRPTDVLCTEAIEPFEMNIPLDVYGLPAGEYQVDVNGVETSFTFEQDNVPQTE
jgi:inhibitor of cysteine peptidase